MDVTCLHEIVYQSFLAEVSALKPGNTSLYATGHNMCFKDFKKSAEVVSPILSNKKLSFGKRILTAVKETKTAVSCNTNLGMILLFVPLIIAAERCHWEAEILRHALTGLIENIDILDSKRVFYAIKIANPGGLGESEQYNITSMDVAPLVAAMKIASKRDQIARQYTTGYEDIFNVGLPSFNHAIAHWHSIEWASVACYLTFLSRFCDSHISRKFGQTTAEQVKKAAVPIADKFIHCRLPEAQIPALLKFDRELKCRGINPGSNADLTAATLLVYHLLHSVK